MDYMKIVTDYICDWMEKRFTGKIVLTFHLHKGGISKVEANVQHDIRNSGASVDG